MNTLFGTCQSCLIWHIVAAMACFCPQCTATSLILRIVFHLVGILATASGVVKDSSIWFSQSCLIGPRIWTRFRLSAWCDSPVGLLFSVWYQSSTKEMNQASKTDSHHSRKDMHVAWKVQNPLKLQSVVVPLVFTATTGMNACLGKDWTLNSWHWRLGLRAFGTDTKVATLGSCKFMEVADGETCKKPDKPQSLAFYMYKAKSTTLCRSEKTVTRRKVWWVWDVEVGFSGCLLAGSWA